MSGNRLSFGSHDTSQLQELYNAAKETLEPFLRKSLQLGLDDIRNHFNSQETLNTFRESPAATWVLEQKIKNDSTATLHASDIQMAVNAAMDELTNAPPGWKPASSFDRETTQAIYEMKGSFSYIIRKDGDVFTAMHEDKKLSESTDLGEVADAATRYKAACLSRESTLNGVTPRKP